MLILRGHKFSLQNALNKVFGALGKLRLVPTASAYCQARQKLDPALFQELTTITAQDFYRLAGKKEPSPLGAAIGYSARMAPFLRCPTRWSCERPTPSSVIREPAQRLCKL